MGLAIIARFWLANSLNLIKSACGHRKNTPFDPIPNVAIEPVFRLGRAKSYHAIVEQAQREKPDWVVLQYQCFSYGKWGFNLELPRAMKQLSRGGTRFALMMHEPWVRVDELEKSGDDFVAALAIVVAGPECARQFLLD
jgi:hypothetical protein